MTLRIHAPNPIRVGETANVLVTSDNPGVVSLTYGAGLTGPASVTIEGTRVYGNMGSGGDYLARLGSEGADREDVTWLFEIDWGKFPADNDSSTNLFTVVPAFGSIRADVANRSNWQFVVRRYGITTISLIYADSLDAGQNVSAAFVANIAGVTPPPREKWALTKATGGAYVLYRAARGTVAASGTRNSTGTMGGSEALIWQSGVSCSKIARVCSDAELDAWFADGTIPATDREFVFAGGHEIDPAAPVIWDLSGNVTPLDLTATQIAKWQAPGMSVAYTDTVPVVPYALVPVTAVATTGTTIDATRPRQGVPSRASAAERIETATQVTVTVEAPLVSIGPDIDAKVESYPDAIILLLTSNVDGDVEIVSDNENLIPMSPVTVIDGRAEVACLVTADVSGATVTASRDPGPSDSCSVTVSDVLAEDWIAVGPNQRTRIEGKRIVWPIRVRSSKDGAFTATASPEAGIIVSGPFEISGGACDITAQPTQAGSWVLTVEQDGRTDSVTLEALTPVAAPTVRQYNLSAEIDGFFDFINRKYGFRPRFTPANVQDVRAEHATDRTYSRYAQGTGQPGSVFGAVALSYQVMISYSSATMAEQDLGILREEADRYGWNAIGFSMTGQTMFEPVKMMPRLTLTLNFDIIPQGR